MSINSDKQNITMIKQQMNRNARFPDDEEIEEFLAEAIPLAEKNAAKNKMELESWMLTDAICMICREFELCDQGMLEAAVERVYERYHKPKQGSGKSG